jgi:hypothetical protein
LTDSKKDNTYVYLLAMVAIVAIVGMVVMFFPRGGSASYVPVMQQPSSAKADVAGQAYRFYYQPEPVERYSGELQRYEEPRRTFEPEQIRCMPTNTTWCINTTIMAYEIRKPDCTVDSGLVHCNNCTMNPQGYASCW